VIIRTLNDVIGSNREMDWGNGVSRRFLLERDGMGYSLTDTIVKANTTSLLEYRNHMEACYCISGSGKVIEVSSGVVHKIEVGTIYALDKNDAHYLVAGDEDLRLVCVFMPALIGHEVHNLNAEASSAY
jgi:L-ectoine synthase